MHRLALVLLVGVARLLCVAGAPAAWAQGVVATYGAYNASAPSLASGAFAPLQLDQNGNVKIDCIIGCGASAGAAQGAPAPAAGAWPFYPVQAGSPVSAANPLWIQDPLDGAPVTGATLPAGGAGILGWLSAMYRLQAGTLSVGGTVSVSNNVAVTDATVANALANPLKTVPFGVTGAPSVSAGAVTTSTAVLAAEPANVNRLHFVVLNLTASGGASLYCTDDNSTPSATSASFIVYAQGFYERDAPGWVPSAAINRTPATGTVAYRAESYP